MLSKYSSPLLLTLLVAKHGLIVKKEWITESYVKKRRLPASKSVILCIICTSFFTLLCSLSPFHLMYTTPVHQVSSLWWQWRQQF